MAGGGFETLHEVAVTDEYDDPIGMKPLSHERTQAEIVRQRIAGIPEIEDLRCIGRRQRRQLSRDAVVVSNHQSLRVAIAENGGKRVIRSILERRYVAHVIDRAVSHVPEIPAR